MLKRVLGESDDSSEIREEDERSHHSDGITKSKGAPGVSEPLDPESTWQPRSSSSSPPREPPHSLRERLEDGAAETLLQNDGRQTNFRKTSDRSRQRKSQRQHKVSVSLLIHYIFSLLLYSLNKILKNNKIIILILFKASQHTDCGCNCENKRP